MAQHQLPFRHLHPPSFAIGNDTWRSLDNSSWWLPQRYNTSSATTSTKQHWCRSTATEIDATKKGQLQCNITGSISARKTTGASVQQLPPRLKRNSIATASTNTTINPVGTMQPCRSLVAGPMQHCRSLVQCNIVGHGMPVKLFTTTSVQQASETGFRRAIQLP